MATASGTAATVLAEGAKTHVAHLLTRLGARDRTQLVVMACQSGLAGELSPNERWCMSRARA